MEKVEIVFSNLNAKVSYDNQAIQAVGLFVSEDHDLIPDHKCEVVIKFMSFNPHKPYNEEPELEEGEWIMSKLFTVDLQIGDVKHEGLKPVSVAFQDFGFTGHVVTYQLPKKDTPSLLGLGGD